MRTSTRDQLAAYGPARQCEAITDWAKRNRHRIVAEVVEDVSGTVAPSGREAWVDVVTRVCGGEADGVAVSDLSRLTRDQVHLELTIDEMSACGARLFSTSGEDQSMLDDPDDPQRKLIRTIIAAINEYDRSMIVQRMQAGRRIKKASGGYAGGQPPFGYRAATPRESWCPTRPNILCSPVCARSARTASQPELSPMPSTTRG
ncbi:recombinase family protein [Rhodococcus sp. BH5]|nr:MULTISPECIES: recombinase family protein [Rhodococcus]MCZ9629557.1 recombinase family protein [Rhodococcus sp. BH5]MEA1796604.1 recombinase family protein [Rhodococcus qingshengii]